MMLTLLTLNLWRPYYPGLTFEYHCCWCCPAPCVAISTHDIDNVDSVSSCLTCGRTSTVCRGMIWIVNTWLCFFWKIWNVKGQYRSGISWHFSIDIQLVLPLLANNIFILELPVDIQILRNHHCTLKWYLQVLLVLIRHNIPSQIFYMF